ncbi:hypothetical protein H4582DRAFT_2101145 [Lactarius indigo]|nr:hypothetical protein H4582DRAFT_2101145 [Lactarius indigo]
MPNVSIDSREIVEAGRTAFAYFALEIGRFAVEATSQWKDDPYATSDAYLSSRSFPTQKGTPLARLAPPSKHQDLRLNPDKVALVFDNSGGTQLL